MRYYSIHSTLSDSMRHAVIRTLHLMNELMECYLLTKVICRSHTMNKDLSLIVAENY